MTAAEEMSWNELFIGLVTERGYKQDAISELCWRDLARLWDSGTRGDAEG